MTTEPQPNQQIIKDLINLHKLKRFDDLSIEPRKNNEMFYEIIKKSLNLPNLTYLPGR